MRLNRIWLFFAFLFTANKGFPQTNPSTASLKLSLTDVWQKADDYSKAIKMQHLKVEASEEKVKDAKVERLPEFEVGGNYEKATNIPIYENGLFHAPVQHEVIHTLYKLSTGAYLNIYNGGKTNLKIAEEKALHEITTERKKLTVSEIHLKAAALYLDLQKSLIYKKLTVEDIAYQEKQLDEIKHFHKNGVVLKSDVLRSELNLSNQKLLLVQIDNDILLATQKLNILIGEPDEAVIDPLDKLDLNAINLQSYDDYLAIAKHKAYDLKISEFETHLKEIELKTVKANVAPKIGMYGDFYYANPQIFLYPYNPHLYSLGIGGIRFSFPISSFYHNYHKEKVAKLDLEQQEVEHSDTEDELRKDVKSAYLRYKEALIRVGVAKVNVAQAEENRRIINETYFNQTSLITDLLDANVQLLQTSFEFEAAQFGAQLKYYQLLHIIGNL